MSLPRKEGTVWVAAAALSLPAYLIPIYNPDLFWHLSAGRWILEHRCLPRVDWLSFTMSGAPWLDFEWLAQLIFEAAWNLGGFGALWLLKGALLLGIWLVIDATLKLHELPAAARAAGLLLWSTAALMHADIRPELFSLLFFAGFLYVLESLRLERTRMRGKDLAGALAIFAIWADIHSGFLIGLTLIFIYGFVTAIEGKLRHFKDLAKFLAAAGLGTLCNPYGLGPYEVAWGHWKSSGELSRTIAEWHAMSIKNPVYWMFWLLLLMSIAVTVSGLSRKGRRPFPWAAMLTTGILAMGALSHERVASFFNITAVFLICVVAATEGHRGLRALRGGTALCAGIALWLIPGIYRGGFFNGQFVPLKAAEFLARQRRVIEPLRVYNPWSWGGYLCWRLAPWHKVFGDGRYLCHAHLSREAQATAEAGRWREFLSEQSIDAALLENLPITLPTVKIYPDGVKKQFQRPFYLFYLPREDWALTYWDEKSLFFVRRGTVPASWLKEHEYRYVRPGDQAAFAEAIERHEIPQLDVDAESLRHAVEVQWRP